MPITYTPIRYPGGKSKLFPLVDSIIEDNSLDGCTYCEAFCGGAGLAAKLLLTDRVSKIVLNDIDPAVYSMWDAIVNHADELCDFVGNVELGIDEWKRQHETFLLSTGPSLELGKAAFYLNRTNRSGILRGGPIGGMRQGGCYKIDARFNRSGLSAKIRALSERSEDIELHNEDACDFIEKLKGRGGLFANYDPPYMVKGPGLYENSYTDEDHEALSAKIASCGFPWIVTYDDTPLVNRLYSDFKRYSVNVGYSAASAKVGNEVLIASPGLKIPGMLKRKAA